MEKEKITMWKDYSFIANGDYPDVSKGDGNFVEVSVVTERGLTADTLYGTSGGPGEPMHFDSFLRMEEGGVSTDDKIIAWKYKDQDQNPEIDKKDLQKLLELLREAHSLVGHPATNQSYSVDEACEKWRKKFEELIKELR